MARVSQKAIKGKELIVRSLDGRMSGRTTASWEVGQCYVTGICSPASLHRYILTNAYDLECELKV